MERSVSTGLKVWLWILIVLDGISAAGSLMQIGDSVFNALWGVASNAIMIYACVLIMFQRKKLGFKIMVIMTAIGAVVSVVLAVVGGMAAGAIAGNAAVGVAGGLVAAVIVVLLSAICPLVTYLLMKKDWDMFE